jgi:3D (Asp-Asp-Asp) domain-containing protein
MKAIFILSIHLILILGCAGRGSHGPVKNSGYQPLSEAEAKIYITPTIYYIPQFDLSEKQSCSTNIFKKLKNTKGETLFNVCSDIYDACLMQGTCELKNKDEIALMNVSDQIENEYRFSQIKNSTCRYGLGASHKVCLDPFFSVAADLSIYKLGQVIYVPKLVDVVLPDGTKHDGYFIIRDSGSLIKGYGRFDFFTGFYLNKKASNPFARVGLAGKENHFLYYVIEGPEADDVLKKRKFNSQFVNK